MSAPQPNPQEIFDLSGRVAVVTGGTGHLGRAMAGALASAGATVVVTSRHVERAQETCKQLSNPNQHLAVPLDYASESSLTDCLPTIIDRLGRVDILINNGNEPVDTGWSSVDCESFDQTTKMASGYFFLSREFRNHVVSRSGSGAIVMIGSMYGMVGSYPDVYEGISSPNGVAYQVAKGGIIQLTRHLAVYWASDGVRVNCLSPGPFPSPGVDSKLVDRIEQKSPLKRIGKPEELAGPLLLLVSDAGSYLTGHNLIVDGGWTAW